MNKRLLIVALAAACSACAISATALARQTDSQSANQPVATAQSGAAKKDTQRAVPPLDSHACIRDTGSHIPPPKGQCLPVAGRSYSQQDIRRTGATNIGQALQMLDPSVTVHGH